MVGDVLLVPGRELFQLPDVVVGGLKHVLHLVSDVLLVPGRELVQLDGRKHFAVVVVLASEDLAGGIRDRGRCFRYLSGTCVSRLEKLKLTRRIRGLDS